MLGGRNIAPTFLIDKRNYIHLVAQGTEGTGSANESIRYSNYINNTWIHPEKISTAGSSSAYPAIGIESNNNLHVAWSVENDTGTYEVYYSSRVYDWHAPENISNSESVDSMYPCVVVNDSNELFIIWTESTTLKYVKRTSAWSNASAVSDITFSTYTCTSAVYDTDNNIHMVWHSVGDIYYSKYINDWSTPTVIYDGDSYYNPSIGIDSHDNLYVTWCDTKTVQFGKYISCLSSWTGNYSISAATDTCMYPFIAAKVTEAGADLAWFRLKNGQNALCYANLETSIPSLENIRPTNGAKDIDVDTNVGFYLKDAGSGVDINSVRITVGGGTVFENGSKAGSYNGTCEKTGDANAYRFEINPGTDFNYYETVTVNVSANDLAAVPNFMEDGFSFTTKSGYMKVTNNLFNPTLGGNQVSIEFAHFYEDGDVSVKLYTLSGEFIKMLYEDFKAKGLPAEFLAWDGKNVEDSTVASGIYLVHIEAPGFKDTKKVAIVK